MARRPTVPKFGEWENESNVPYTAYFDKARQTRGNEKLNPNDPANFPELLASREPEKRGQRGPDTARPNPNRARPNGGARPEVEQRRNEPKKRNEQGFGASPLHQNQNGRLGGSTTPVRGNARNKPIRSVHDSDDFGSAVPKFGDWENNQESGEGYTEKFNKFSQDRKIGAVAPTPPGYSNGHGASKSPEHKKCFCFPW